MAVKLIDNPNTNALCEAMQANEVKFTFVSMTTDCHFLACIPWVKCREYFNEFLMSNIHETDGFNETYGLTYNRKEFPWDYKNPHIALKFINNDHRNTFMQNIKFLHDIEDVNKFTHTEIIESEYPQPTVILKLDSGWIGKCVSFNIYTTLLKLMCFSELCNGFSALNKIKINGSRPAEITYIESIGEQQFSNVCQAVSVINNIKSKFIDGSSEKRERYTIHGASGIYTILRHADTREDRYGLNVSFIKTIQDIANNENFPSIFKEAA